MTLTNFKRTKTPSFSNKTFPNHKVTAKNLLYLALEHQI